MHSRIDRPIPHEVQRRFGVRRRSIAVKQPPYGEDNCTNNEANAARFEIQAGAHRRTDPRTSFDRHGSSLTLLLRSYLLSHLLARVSLSTRSDRCSRGRRGTLAWAFNASVDGRTGNFPFARAPDHRRMLSTPAAAITSNSGGNSGLNGSGRVSGA